MGSIGRAHEQFLVLAFYCLIVILFKEINVLYLIYDIHNIVVIITVAQGKYNSSEYGELWSDFHRSGSDLCSDPPSKTIFLVWHLSQPFERSILFSGVLNTDFFVSFNVEFLKKDVYFNILGVGKYCSICGILGSVYFIWTVLTQIPRRYLVMYKPALSLCAKTPCLKMFN